VRGDLAVARAAYMQTKAGPALKDQAAAVNDEDLLERICERDVEALAELYDRYGGQAFALEAEDMPEKHEVAAVLRFSA